MERDQQHSAKHRQPIAELKSVEELYVKGELSRRRESNFAVNIMPLLAGAIAIFLVLSPESRALAIEIGAKGIEIGKEWVLRGLLE